MFLDIPRFMGTAILFLLIIISLFIFPCSFAQHDKFWFLFSNKIPITIHLGNEAVNESQSSITLNGSNAEEAAVRFYTTIEPRDNLDNQVTVNCSQKPDLTDIPLMNNTIIHLRNNTTITCYQDGAEINTFTVNLRDTNPPFIYQHSDMSINAPVLPGAFLNYHVSANDSDNSHNSVQVSCNPPPHAFIQPGRVNVGCSAIDKAGNRSPSNMTFAIDIHNDTRSVLSLSPNDITNLATVVANLATTSILPPVLNASYLVSTTASDLRSIISMICTSGSGNSNNSTKLQGDKVSDHSNPVIGKLNTCNLPSLHDYIKTVELSNQKASHEINQTIDKIITNQSATAHKIAAMNKNLTTLSASFKAIQNRTSSPDNKLISSNGKNESAIHGGVLPLLHRVMFRMTPSYYAADIYCNSTKMLNIQQDHIFLNGTRLSCTFKANPEYTFSSWSIANNQSSSNNATFIVSKDTILDIHFGIVKDFWSKGALPYFGVSGLPYTKFLISVVLPYILLFGLAALAIYAIYKLNKS
jgi:hypothetical protein